MAAAGETGMHDGARKRILIVEDEPLVAMLLEDMLTDLGFDVAGPALRLERGLELASSDELDAAILDVNLGGSRSYEVAEALRERGVPFAFATGYDELDSDDQEQVPIVRKPYRQDQIKEVLRQLIGC
jgi:DNA-binding response OmpR family regulator